MFRRLSFMWIVLPALTSVAHAEKPEQRQALTQPNGDRVIAIDVLLVPDATMTKKAIAANTRLRENYPKGYTLGPEQVPHITLVHGFVSEKDLRSLEVTVSKLADATQLQKWELTATGYTYAIWSGVAITTIGIERSRRLDVFQEKIAKAVNHDAVANGTASAFSKTRELPKIDKEIIDYVKNFVANSSGQKYNPHVTIGVAHENFVKQLTAEPFAKFSFKPAGVAIYQLGNFGTAQKKLWEWNPK